MEVFRYALPCQRSAVTALLVAKMALGRGLYRTFAKLSRKGGADLERIQHDLDHASLLTMQRYLGTALDLAKEPYG